MSASAGEREPARAGSRTARWSLPRSGVLEWASATVALLWLAQSYVKVYHWHFAVVWNPARPQWWEWNDQGKYLRAAMAWASGDLDPSQHWYFPGYPVLGALFVPWSPGHPFYLVDLACLLGFGALLLALSGRLAPDRRWAWPTAALVLVVTVSLTRLEMKAFVEPWTTTPTAAPLTLGAAVLAFRLWERPSPGRAGLLGLVAASVFLFRPMDAVPVCLAAAATTAWALRRQLTWRLVGAGAAGALLPVLVAGTLHLLVFGMHKGLYLEQSGQTGFEWRLIPLHWVTIVVSPLPQYPGSFSLAQTFPWLIPGVAGMVACLVGSRGMLRLRHALVIGTVLLHCGLYLAYRDLHPPGLFVFGNYHYFKWCLPVFGLYSVYLVALVPRLDRRWAAWGAGLAAAAFLFSWRVSWRMLDPAAAGDSWASGHRLVLSHAPRSVNDGVFVAASGGRSQIYLGNYEMRVGERVFQANADFKAFPVPGGLVFTVLRPMPPGPAVVDFSDGVTLETGRPVFLREKFALRGPRWGAAVKAYYRRWLRSG